MKKVIIINGPMGVGKTTVGKALCQRLEQSAFVDGDWCFDLHPFVATNETRAMAVDNICHLVRNYIGCSECACVVLSWLMDRGSVYQAIVDGISDLDVRLYHITLTCSQAALESRWRADKRNDWRIDHWLEISRASLPYFCNLDTAQLDTSMLAPTEVADRILQVINQ